ncbi:hypothetical protein ATANTOWER_031405, partial [Ataeniobius toweri]|nr:hypothetical protein [Ataeniobius toweri]
LNPVRWRLLNLLLSGSRTKRTLSTLQCTYLRARHQYSSLRSSGIQLQAGTEFIHLAPLCLSLHTKLHPPNHGCKPVPVPVISLNQK